MCTIYQCTLFCNWSGFSCNDIIVGVVDEDKEVCLFSLRGADLIGVLVAEESVSFNFEIFEDKLLRVCT